MYTSPWPIRLAIGNERSTAWPAKCMSILPMTPTSTWLPTLCVKLSGMRPREVLACSVSIVTIVSASLQSPNRLFTTTGASRLPSLTAQEISMEAKVSLPTLLRRLATLTGSGSLFTKTSAPSGHSAVKVARSFGGEVEKGGNMIVLPSAATVPTPAMPARRISLGLMVSTGVRMCSGRFVICISM